MESPHDSVRKGSRVVDELKKIIFRQNEVIDKLQRQRSKSLSTPSSPSTNSTNSKMRESLKRSVHENEKLKATAIRYKRERDELLDTSKVLEEYVYVFKQERDQLRREMQLMEKNFSNLKRKFSVASKNIAQAREEVEDEYPLKKFKYKSIVNPRCSSCSKLESRLVKQKAVNLENLDKLKAMQGRLKKNVSIYRKNLSQVNKEVKTLCGDVVQQAAQVEGLKNNFLNLSLDSKPTS